MLKNHVEFGGSSFDTRGGSRGLEEDRSFSSEGGWTSPKLRCVSSKTDYLVLFI